MKEYNQPLNLPKSIVMDEWLLKIENYYSWTESKRDVLSISYKQNVAMLTYTTFQYNLN